MRSTIPFGKRDGGVEPRQELVALGRGQGRHELADQPARVLAVREQVVAAEHGDRGRVVAQPQLQAAHDPAERRARRPVAAQVRPHGGGVEVEAVGAGGVGVAVLGDRQGDDGRAGRRDGGGHRVRLPVGDQHAGVHRGHGHPRAVGRDLHHGVAQVLGAHRVRDGGRAARDTEDPPRPVGVGQRGGGVDGLVGAVEVAQPEVHDPGLGHGAAVQEGGGGQGRGAKGGRWREHSGHQSVMEPSRRRATGR